jgi:hypothetical protein
VVPQDLFEYRRDYLALGPEFHADMSLMDYCLMQEHRLQSQRCKHGGKDTTSQHDRVSNQQLTQ